MMIARGISVLLILSSPNSWTDPRLEVQVNISTEVRGPIAVHVLVVMNFVTLGIPEFKSRVREDVALENRSGGYQLACNTDVGRRETLVVVYIGGEAAYGGRIMPQTTKPLRHYHIWTYRGLPFEVVADRLLDGKVLGAVVH